MQAEHANRIHRKHLVESAGRTGKGELCTGGPRPGELEQRGMHALEDQGLTGSTGWTQETAGFQAQGRNIQMGAGEQLSLVFSGRKALNLFICSQVPTPNLW